METGVVAEAQGDAEELLVEVAGSEGDGDGWHREGARGGWSGQHNGAPGPSRCVWWLEDKAPTQGQRVRTWTMARGRLTRQLTVVALRAPGVAMGSTKRKKRLGFNRQRRIRRGGGWRKRAARCTWTPGGQVTGGDRAIVTWPRACTRAGRDTRPWAIVGR
jgi:hypothetical protein